ncbi:hypothetical protein OG402_38325 [Streptomyces anulatus]|uniref:hypothetical protein n=1 Tax=Streptomyces anulatus TaxID=1892 RepID=UPI00224C84F0|nr:hypothetical protein [Streptomyces anulatus]MCX4516068.1 hypothetical protein [Streptomyces anulatus]MCX4523297.1 hypothetical protein [Streptomyces anulatus]MCX4598895.1 hypothetical protein [Streptomyces anulatus]MCX4606307.1 hypothetical protein [Streptomyces anulatus]WSU71431.1 hypothetical protein OG499_00060 [Streptomyces anulatus]
MPLALALTGCGGGDDGAKPSAAPPAASSPTPAATTSADPDAAEKTAVITSYEAMTREQMKAYRQADATGTDLEKYATTEALGQIRNDLANMQTAGTVVRGELGHDTEVTGLDMEAQTPTATLSDCVDLSGYETYDVKAKKVIPLPTEQPLRYVMTATAQRWDGRWMVTDIDPQGGAGATC